MLKRIKIVDTLCNIIVYQRFKRVVKKEDLDFIVKFIIWSKQVYKNLRIRNYVTNL